MQVQLGGGEGQDRGKKVAAGLKVRDFPAVQLDLYGAAPGNVALHPAEGSRGFIQVVRLHLSAEPAAIVGRVVDKRRHHGDFFFRPLPMAVVDLLAVIGNVQRHALMPGLVPDGDDRVRGAEIDAEPAGHALFLFFLGKGCGLGPA